MRETFLRSSLSTGRKKIYTKNLFEMKKTIDTHYTCATLQEKRNQLIVNAR